MDTISSYTPSWRERLTTALQDGFIRAGMPKYDALRLAEKITGQGKGAIPEVMRGMGLLDVTPVGNLLAQEEDPEMGTAMFVGPLSKTWDKVAAAKAEALEKAGKDARTIWKETGTLRGPEGLLRQEISDDAAKLREYNFTPAEAFKNAVYGAEVGSADHVRALSMRPYAGMTKNELTKEYARTGGEIVDAALAGDKAKALQLDKDRAGLNDLLGAMHDRRYGPVSNFLKHGEFGKAYPDAYKMHFRVADDLGTARGQYVKGTPHVGEQVQMSEKPRWTGDKSTLLHELQHAIQQREGWARGGSPDMAFRDPRMWGKDEAAGSDIARKMLKDRVASLNKPLSLEEYAKQAWGQSEVTQEIRNAYAKDYLPAVKNYKLDGADMREMQQDIAREWYRRLAGEAEARATQARMNLNAQQRRLLFPFDSYDVPVEDLIVRY